MGTTILGGTGFIGHNLAQTLDAFTPCRSALYTLGTNLGRVFYCLGDDAGAIEPNLGYLLWFLKHCSFESLIYLSSTRVYLGAQGGEEGTTLTLSPGDPGYQYNVVKLAAEAACLADERCKVVRLSTVVGPNKAQYLIPGLIQSAQLGEMNLHLPSDFVRDLITIEDVIELLPKIANGQHKLYNLASGVNFTLGSIVSAIQYVTKAKAIWHPHKPTSVFPKISIERVKAEFGFEPRPVLPAIQELCIG